MIIHCDMDGVLVDFLGPALKALGRSESPGDITDWYFYKDWGFSDKEFWASVEGFDFWSTLPVLDHAYELLNLCLEYSEDVLITTKIQPSCKGCIPGKAHSLATKFPAFEYNLVTKSKAKLASPNSILIDDNDTNCTDFSKAGGKSILFPATYNANRALADNPMDFVRKMLKTFAQANSFHTDEEEIVADPNTGSKKGQKPSRYDLIPVRPLRLLARRFGYGALKYSIRNWEGGYNWSSSYSALQRHLNAFWDGEDIDPDDPHGQTHLSAVMWHAFALTEYWLRGTGTDDRPYKK